jgi:hypothetical protein
LRKVDRLVTHGRANPRYLVCGMDVLPEEWHSWYRLALENLGYEHAEAVEYATARYVEERNLARLRESAGPRRERAAAGPDAP